MSRLSSVRFLVERMKKSNRWIHRLVRPRFLSSPLTVLGAESDRQITASLLHRRFVREDTEGRRLEKIRYFRLRSSKDFMIRRKLTGSRYGSSHILSSSSNVAEHNRELFSGSLDAPTPDDGERRYNDQRSFSSSSRSRRPVRSSLLRLSRSRRIFTELVETGIIDMPGYEIAPSPSTLF